MPRFCQLMFTALVAGFVVATPAPLPADEKQSDSKTEQISVFGVATMEVPEQFKRAPKGSGILEHEFKATSGEGDDADSARITMMGASGGIEANIARWKGQFSGEDKSEEVEDLKIGQWLVYMVDVSGNYADSMGRGPFAPGPKVVREDYAMTGAILKHPEGRTYFVKMIGPEKVVKENREAFVKMIKSIAD